MTDPHREELIEKIAFGAASIGNDFHHSPAMPYWPADIPQREYDPDKAPSRWRDLMPWYRASYFCGDEKII